MAPVNGPQRWERGVHRVLGTNVQSGTVNGAYASLTIFLLFSFFLFRTTACPRRGREATARLRGLTKMGVQAYQLQLNNWADAIGLADPPLQVKQWLLQPWRMNKMQIFRGLGLGR